MIIFSVEIDRMTYTLNVVSVAEHSNNNYKELFSRFQVYYPL